ncbi:MAG: caspase family protein, partial [Thiomargarita sp.]|nr:caspase family protein [Thiomargarita sp.]
LLAGFRYDKKFKLLAKRKAPGGNQPYAVDFSPTGNKVVVGFADSNTINVLSGMDLTLLSEPQTLGVNGNLNTVAWSKDGQWLYAGGTHLENNQTFILRWNQADQNRYDKWPAASNTILDIRALREGGLVFATFDPTFGRFNANGEKILERDAGIADFRVADFHYNKGLQVSMEGSQIKFDYNQGGKKRPGRFSVHGQTLAVKSLDKRQQSMTTPIINSSYFDITGGINSSDFKINGKQLQLQPQEMARSFAITPDEQHILVGTDWSLQLLDRKGQIKWQQTVPAIPWNVNIAGNGKVAVAAFSDGILRWYRISDGAELLAYFPYYQKVGGQNKENWIMWTPRGHYMASPGGENIMGWYINRGQTETAQFFPLKKLRDQFYSPNIVKTTLMLRDIDDAILLADDIADLKQAFKKNLNPNYSPEMVTAFVDNLKLAEASRSLKKMPAKKMPAKKPPVKQRQSKKTTLQESLPPEIEMLALVEPEPDAKTETRGISNVASRGISGVVSRGVSGVVSSGSKKASFATSVVELRYSLRLPSGEPITALQVLVDGQKIGSIKNKNSDDASKPIEICDLSQQTRGISNVASRGISNVASRGISNVASRDVSTSFCQLPKDEKEYHLRVSLPPRDVKFGLVVENRFVTSQPLAIELQWTGKVTETPQPNLYVLAVGVSKYDNKELTLNFAAKDANDFANAFQNQKGKLYKEVTIKKLPDASKKEVLDGLAWLRSQVQLGDVAMLFIAGHGVNIGGHGSDSKQQYFFLPRDAKVKTETEIKGSSVFFRDIKKTVMNLPGKVLFFLDTCHSGNVMGDGLIDVDEVTNDLGSAEREAIVVLTATTGEQLALESPDWGNGAFTKTLLEGLRGEADYKGDKEISFKEIDLYLSDGVEELTDGQQTPTVAIPRAVRNFPLISIP